MRRLLISILMLWTISILPACGGRGGGSNNDPGTPPPTQAVVRIMTSGSLPGGTLIGGIDSALNLPAGVSVKATTDAENPDVLVADSGVVTVSGVATGTNTTALGTYDTATNRVAIHVVNAEGFGTGEFATITCDIAAGATVAATDFGLGSFTALDLNGAAIPGLTPGITAELRQYESRDQEQA